ncbi:MAG: alanine--glyoxylate aminotransferase family protein [Bdellovibrionaceae bacterium]|nr:alanine--glyoxylate aminotransferase family protein [Pseudobdellovibrionaceae bacterium]
MNNERTNEKNGEKLYDYSLLAPGPVNLHPDVRQALALPMIHHRTPQFDEILKRVLTRLKLVFGTDQAVYMHSSTGSGGMESLLVNVLSPEDQVLVVISGKFGERWAEMAEAFGAHITTLSVPWGESVNPQVVREALEKNPKIRAVLCQACETSTGALHPIQELGLIISKFPNCLFLVDGITAVGAFPLPMDEYKIDGLVAGSQKAFMLPTGLAFVSFSQKAQARFSEAKMKRYYFDIRREQKANLQGETFFSSSVILVRALDVVLDLILAKGLPTLYEEIQNRAQLTRHIAPLLGFKIYPHCPSNSLTALTVPAGVDGQQVRAYLEKHYSITIMGGQDQAKGKIIRIGHMGYILPQEMDSLFECLALTLAALNHPVSPVALLQATAAIRTQGKNT